MSQKYIMIMIPFLKTLLPEANNWILFYIS